MHTTHHPEAIGINRGGHTTTKQKKAGPNGALPFSCSIFPSLQRLDVSGAFGHQVTGTGVLADLFTELLVIARR